MQTVTVKLKTNETSAIFIVGETGIAQISESRQFKGKFFGWIYGFSGNDGECSNYSYPEALEFVSDVIEARFKRLGLNVEFK